MRRWACLCLIPGGGWEAGRLDDKVTITQCNGTKIPLKENTAVRMKSCPAPNMDSYHTNIIYQEKENDTFNRHPQTQTFTLIVVWMSYTKKRNSGQPPAEFCLSPPSFQSCFKLIQLSFEVQNSTSPLGTHGKLQATPSLKPVSAWHLEWEVWETVDMQNL